MINLGDLAKKQHPRRILNPSEIMDCLFGAEATDQAGKKHHYPGITEMIDQHVQLIRNQDIIIFSLCRILGIQPEDLITAASESVKNKEYINALNEIEEKKLSDQRQNELEAAAHEAAKDTVPGKV